MKNCVKCGASLDDSAKFCKACGASQPSSAGGTSYGSGSTSYSGTSYSSGPNIGSANGYGGNTYGTPGTPPGYQQYRAMPPMSIGGWIGRSFGLGVLACVPFVGWIACIVVLIMWSRDMSKDQTFRNWAKAQLVVYAVLFAIMLLIIIFSVAGIFALDAYL